MFFVNVMNVKHKKMFFMFVVLAVTFNLCNCPL